MNLFQRSVLTGKPWDEEDINHYSKWRAASGHPSGKWRVHKTLPQTQDLEGPNGKLLLFKTYESAQKRADSLNSQSTPNSKSKMHPDYETYLTWLAEIAANDPLNTPAIKE